MKLNNPLNIFKIGFAMLTPYAKTTFIKFNDSLK